MVTVVGQRGIAWRALSGGGGDWLGARREVRSTGGARGGVGGAVPWLEVPGDGGAPVDMAAASDTLPGSTALSTRRSRPVLEEGVAPDAQLDRALEARRHGSSTAATRSRGARLARLEEQSNGIGSFRGIAWCPAARRRGTARGGEAGDVWAAAPMAGAVVTWFLLDAKAGIRVAVDKARHVASETVAVEVGGRWRGSVDTHNEHGDEAMARACKRWARLTGGPSPLLI
jgi:hypothetical protein